jgi:hypothetical protein
MLTIKQKLLLECLPKIYNIHKKTTELTEEYCKSLVKLTVDEIYKIYPDRNVGRLSINWYNHDFIRTPKIDDSTTCFEINFHDVYTGKPWLICRFYKGTSKAYMYYRQ